MRSLTLLLLALVVSFDCANSRRRTPSIDCDGNDASREMKSACWMGLDGTTFVLEGADPSRYQLVDRWEEFEPPLESAVELLLAISGNKSE
jgi:hypothetical protein